MHRISGSLTRFAMISLFSMLFLAGCGDATTTTAPTITSFNPTSDSVGRPVTITGTGFDTTKANNTVKFNGTTATVTSATSTSITATVPLGATDGPISVTVGGQTVSTTSNFKVAFPIAVSPIHGAIGTTVTITGTGTSFDATTTVKFTGATATVVVPTSSTIISTTVPSGATTGTITVTTGLLSASCDFAVP